MKMKLNKVASILLISGLAVAITQSSAFARGHDGKHNNTNVFNALDADSDGVLSETEFSAAKSSRRSRYFSHIDSDSNGLISQEEYEAKIYKHLSRLGIDEADMDACMQEQLGDDYQARTTWTELLAAADSDSDGQISEDELTTYEAAKVTEKFNELDTDADGSLDTDEFAVMQEARSTQRAARRTCVSSLLDD